MPRKEPPFWVEFFIYLALFVVAELIRPKPKFEDAKPAGIGDFQAPTATEGRVVPLLWGTVQIAGPNVVWYGNLQAIAIKESVRTSMFNKERVTVGFTYFIGMQFALCRGQANQMLRVWIGEDLAISGNFTHEQVAAIDQPNLFGGVKVGQGGVVGNLRFHDGRDDQDPSSYLAQKRLFTNGSSVSAGSGYSIGDLLTAVGGTFTEAAVFDVHTVDGGGAVLSFGQVIAGKYTVPPTNPVSVTGGSGTGFTLNVTVGPPNQSELGDTPAYPGTVYCMLEDGYVGTSPSLKPWKFETQRIVTGPATGGDLSINGGMDCNPVNVLYEIITNKDWGLGFETSDVDSPSFAAAGATLKAEGNGFSMLLDNPLEALDLMSEIERQIDGALYYDMAAAKCKIKLARADYDINTVPELSPSTFLELVEFSRGAWEETSNQVRIQFNDRDDSYKVTYAFASDMANVRLQNGVNISVQEFYPGVKNRTLANAIAWRQLRALGYPLAKGKVIVDRRFFGVQQADVLALTDPDLDIVRLPIRITKVDLGELEDNRITLDFVQDVFYFQIGSFGDPVPSGWVPPTDTLEPFDADKQIAFEAPRGFVTRDPAGFGIADKIWASGRRKGVEVGFLIRERHSAGTPSGAFSAAGQSFNLVLIGRLNGALAAGTAFPTSSIVVKPTPDNQASLESAFLDGLSVQDASINLQNLVLIDNEFMIVAGGAQNSGANVQMNTVYRAALDTVQASHAAGAQVWLLFAGGALTDTVFPPGNNVDIKLLPESTSDTVLEADATTIAVALANRVRRPYPPSLVKLGGTTYATTIGLEQTGSGETLGFAVDINRRDYRTVDEIQALTADAATLFPDFPAANTTTHDYDVRNDPAGANTLLFSVTGLSGASFNVLRIDILKATNGVLPTTLRLAIRSQHLDGAVSYSSRYDLVWDFAATSGLTGQFNFGALAQNVDSANYTATVNGTYAFTLSTSFSSGDVEFRLNAGAWTTLIAAGGTTGNILGVVSTDVIEVRHTSGSAGAKKFLAMNAPGAGQDGYAILYV